MSAGHEILNLGCGNEIVGNADNHDLLKHRGEIACVWDLNERPWPWEDNRYRLVIAKSVLEHLRITLVDSLNECWRILKPGGQIYLKLPHWSVDAAWADPTHYWKFSVHCLEQFDPETERGRVYSFYTPYKWKVTMCQLNKGGSSILARMMVRK